MQKKSILKLTDFINNSSLSVIYYKYNIVLIDGHVYIVITILFVSMPQGIRGMFLGSSVTSVQIGFEIFI
jgi:hypothetical protein